MKQVKFLNNDFTLNDKYIKYTGEAELDIKLHIYDENELHLKRWCSYEESGYIVQELINIIQELIKHDYINKNTYLTLTACDISDETEGRIENPSLNNLVRYYDKLGFNYDPYKNTDDPETLSMKCKIDNFLKINQSSHN